MTTPAEHTRPRTLEESLEPCPFCGAKGDAVSEWNRRHRGSALDDYRATHQPAAPMRLPSGCAQADIDVGEQPEEPQP